MLSNQRRGFGCIWTKDICQITEVLENVSHCPWRARIKDLLRKTRSDSQEQITFSLTYKFCLQDKKE